MAYQPDRRDFFGIIAAPLFRNLVPPTPIAKEGVTRYYGYWRGQECESSSASCIGHVVYGGVIIPVSEKDGVLAMTRALGLDDVEQIIRSTYGDAR